MASSFGAWESSLVNSRISYVLSVRKHCFRPSHIVPDFYAKGTVWLASAAVTGFEPALSWAGKTGVKFPDNFGSVLTLSAPHHVLLDTL